MRSLSVSAALAAVLVSGCNSTPDQEFYDTFGFKICKNANINRVEIYPPTSVFDINTDYTYAANIVATRSCIAQIKENISRLSSSLDCTLHGCSGTYRMDGQILFKDMGETLYVQYTL